MAGRPADQPDRREFIAAFGRGHRGRVDQRERGEQRGEADDQPDAPCPVDIGGVDGVEVLAAAHLLHARTLCGVARERPSGRRAARDEQRGVGGDRGVASCDGGIEQDVPEPGRAVVDRGYAQRGRRCVSHPDRHRVAHPQAAGIREHAAYGNGVVADVTQRATDHNRVERAHCGRAAQAGGRPRTLVAETLSATDAVSGVAGGGIEIGPASSGTWQALPTESTGNRLVARIDDAALPAARISSGCGRTTTPATKHPPTSGPMVNR